jgi:hypothetical protein
MTPGAPSGSGGILLLHVFARNEPSAYTTPTGWTAINDVASRRQALYARLSDGGANDTPTVAPPTGTDVYTAVISRWTGGNTTLGSLLNNSSAGFFAAETSPNGNITVPAITPSVDNCLVLRMGKTANDDGTWTAAPSGDTLLTQVQVNLDVDMSAAICYRIQTTAAAVGAGDITNGAASADGHAVAFALTESAGTKHLKLLAHSSAASATGVEGVVLNAARDTVIGEFTGQAFEASLESDKAVLLIPVEDIIPDGSTLTTTDTPLVAAYNSTDGTVGLGSATVIEV